MSGTKSIDQTSDVGADNYVMGSLKARLNSELSKPSKDLESRILERTIPTWVPCTNYPLNRTLFVSSEDLLGLYDLGICLTVATITPLIDTNYEQICSNLEKIIQYLTLTIYQFAPPSTANVMGFKVYLYTEEQIILNGFTLVGKVTKTKLSMFLPTTYYEYEMELVFDDRYNTEWVEAPRLDTCITPPWKTFKRRGLSPAYDTTGEKFNPLGLEFSESEQIAVNPFTTTSSPFTTTSSPFKCPSVPFSNPFKYPSTPPIAIPARSFGLGGFR